MKPIKIFFHLSLILLISSCGTIKEGFKNQKKDSSDEFLVQKKNPLVVPPDYMKLPKPKDSEDEELLIEEETDIQKLLQIKNDENFTTNSEYGNAEEFVIKNLKK